MLAYVFWHWRKVEIAARDYEAWLATFHETLADDPPPGWIRSAVFAITGAPWGAVEAETYEDWHWVANSAALDVLNDAAVKASRIEAHDRAAHAAAGGTGGLYRLRLGAAPETPHYATWFAKPDGMTYGDLYDLVRERIGAVRAALWGRQMTLGPTPEFCLHSVEPIALPDAAGGLVRELRRVTPR